jgi:hypothetical protein
MKLSKLDDSSSFGEIKLDGTSGMMLVFRETGDDETLVARIFSGGGR